jgi:hypothetical protein
MFFNAIFAALFLFDNQKSAAVYFGSVYRTSLAVLTTRNLLNDFSTLTALLTEPQKQHENTKIQFQNKNIVQEAILKISEYHSLFLTTELHDETGQKLRYVHVFLLDFKKLAFEILGFKKSEIVLY